MLRITAITILTLMLRTAAAAGQATGAVTGTIVFESGVPLTRAIVWTIAAGQMREARTDSMGRYRLDLLLPGKITIEVICPNQLGTFEARVAVPRTAVTVTGDRNTQLDATVPPRACKPIRERTVRVHWRGIFSHGFEENSFYPCPTDSVARELGSYGHPFGREAWVRFTPTAWRKAGIGKLGENPQTGGETGFVEWSGMVRGPTEPTNHGYYELTVDSIFAMAPKGTCE